MGEIKIGDAPAYYRRYLRVADAHEGQSGYDGKINTEEEAQSAVESYCGANKTGCEGLLDFLAKAGDFNLSKVRKEIKTEETKSRIDSLIAELRNKDEIVRSRAAEELLVIIKAGVSVDQTYKITTNLMKSLEKTPSVASLALREIALSNIHWRITYEIVFDGLIPTALISKNKNTRDSAAEELVKFVNLNKDNELNQKIIDNLINRASSGNNEGILAVQILSGIVRSGVSEELTVKIVDSLLERRCLMYEPNGPRIDTIIELGKIARSKIPQELKVKIINSLTRSAVQYGNSILAVAIIKVFSYVASSDGSNDVRSTYVSSVQRLQTVYCRNNGERAALQTVSVAALGDLGRVNISQGLRAEIIAIIEDSLSIVSDNTKVQEFAIDQLGMIAGSCGAQDASFIRIFERVVRCLGDEKPSIRGSAISALGRIALSSNSQELRPEIVGYIIDALGDKDKNVRDSAAVTLNVILKSDIRMELKAKIEEALKK